jgi:hypothetical protein
MMGQRVVVLCQAFGKEPLDGLRSTFMQAPPPLQQPVFSAMKEDSHWG